MLSFTPILAGGIVSVMQTSHEIEILDQSPLIDELLGQFSTELGSNLKPYRGHLLRVLTYALHFLEGDRTHLPTMEVALVYHDIGVWTANTLAYLEPSVALAVKDNDANGWGYDAELLRDIIYWHHKITPFRGRHANVVNAIRKADWIDASNGRIRKGLSRETIATVEAAIPSEGFHASLKSIGASVAGSRMAAFRDLLKVIKV